MDKVIAIDGPSGVGKSSVSRHLARRLGWTYLDTGAMYRAVTLAWIRAGAKPGAYADQQWLDSLELGMHEKQVFLNGEDVSGPIREQQVTAKASEVAAHPNVRCSLTSQQRAIARAQPCILDGRDIGTVVFPNAFFKIYLMASAQERARRRWLQLGGEKSEMSEAEILADQRRRDTYDANRETAPLKQADDAWAFNTDAYDLNGVVDALYSEALARLTRLPQA